MNNKLIFYWLTSLSIIGIVLGSILLFEHYHYIAASVCNINSTFNCSAIAIGSLSKLFGIPIPYFGLTGYVAILIASLCKAKRTVFLIALAGFLFCLRITLLEIFQVHIICPVCLACQFDMILVLCFTMYLNFKKS